MKEEVRLIIKELNQDKLGGAIQKLIRWDNEKEKKNNSGEKSMIMMKEIKMKKEKIVKIILKIKGFKIPLKERLY